MSKLASNVDIEMMGYIVRDQDASLQHPGVSMEQDGELLPPDKDDLKLRMQSSDPKSCVHSIEPTFEAQRPKLSQTGTRSSSIYSRTIVVPRAQRRGLLGRLALIPEVENPHAYGRGTKWMITFLIALAAAAAPMGSAIFYPALPTMAVELDTSTTITNLSVAMYMLSMSIFPLWWSSFSESFGRRTIYLISFSLFVIFAVLSAVSVNIAMLIVMRMLSGGAAASVQAVGAGTVADVWEVKERGRAMGIFYLGPLMGPLLAPIIGGVLSEKLGWRSTQWFLAIYGACLILILTFALPETLNQKALPRVAVQDTGMNEKTTTVALTRTVTRQSITKQTKRWLKVLHRIFIEPLFVLAYLKFPAVALTVYYAAITFGTLYVLNISIQQTFAKPPYNFSEIIVGLMYIPTSAGYVISSIGGGPWCDKIMHREAKAAGRYTPEGKLILIPEDRLRENAWFAALVYPGALIWYGWSVDRGVHWIVPAFALFFFGLGSMIIFSCATTMLTEFMPRKSSSGVAVNNFVRNIFSCVGGVVAAPLIDKITNGWLFTGLAVICWLSSGVVFAIRRYGPKWRVTMMEEMSKES